MPAARLRLGRVDDQVDQHLLHLIRVEVGRQLGSDRVLERDGSRKQGRICAGVDEALQAHGPPLGRTVSGQVQQVVDRLVGALDLGADAVEVFGDLWHGGIRTQVLADEVERRFDHPQRVAQLVADARRELSDRRQSFGVSVLGLQILAIGFEHDRQLQIDDLVQGRRDPLNLGGIGDLLAQDIEQVNADPVHRREHVALGQGDPDVDPPDSGAQLVIGLVVGAKQHPVDPLDQGPFEPFDLRGPARDGGSGLWMGFDRGVKVVDDRDEEGLGDRMELAQRGRRRIREADVELDAFEEGRGAHDRFRERPSKVRACRPLTTGRLLHDRGGPQSGDDATFAAVGGVTQIVRDLARRALIPAWVRVRPRLERLLL